jgi:NhaP-type Na+/H+ and K+/H+ antiporter
MTGINALFLLTGLLLFISVLASTISARLGLPLLLLFLGVGMLAGEDGPGGIVFEDFFIASLIGQAALSVILLDGGLRTRVSSFRVGLKRRCSGCSLPGSLMSIGGSACCWRPSSALPMRQLCSPCCATAEYA